MRNGGYYKSIETYDYAAKHVEEICLLSNPHTFKVQASAGKIMCNVFWDAVDPVASLGWVTPLYSFLFFSSLVPTSAVSSVVSSLFFSKPGDLFLLIAVTITIAFYCFHSGASAHS